MKYLLTLIMPLMLMMTACEQSEYVVPNRTVIVDVQSRDWTTYDKGYTYETDIDLPEYDNYNNEQGAILVYVSGDGRYYEQVPQVIDGFAYSYGVTAGTLTLRLQNSDAIKTITPPTKTVTFKIVLIDSSY